MPDIERRATKKEGDKDGGKEEEEEQEDEETKYSSVLSHSLTTLSIDDVTTCHNDSPTKVRIYF